MKRYKDKKNGFSRISHEEVYDLVSKIPEGKITTYGDIAKFLGNKRSSRRIGKILNQNPNPIIVPCHRVVLSTGMIGGYAYGVKMKKRLLENEGITIFKNDVIENFSSVRYQYEV